MKNLVFVVIPSWNGAEDLPGAIESILGQSFKNLRLVVVDNGSSDGSRKIIETYQKKDKRVQGIYLDKNYGFTGGVIPGMQLALDEHAEFVAPFNNDAIADKDWLKYLVEFLQKHKDFGIAACKLLHADGKTIDSTGDQYSIWGLPYPRGRDEPTSTKYDHDTVIFGASGGASLYRASMLHKVGLFDDDYFAYCEDIDLSFRAQLAGWKVSYVPASKAYHQQGATSSKMGDFATYQSFKNFPVVIVKNVPRRLLGTVIPRFLVAYAAFFVSALRQGRAGAALRGIVGFIKLWPKKARQRRTIQAQATVDAGYIDSLLLRDLPPSQHKLRKLRRAWWKLRGKKA